MNGLIAIELTPAQSTFFALCNQQFDAISFMAQAGVFQLRKANAILSFDDANHLKSIKTEIYHYPQGKDIHA